MSSRIRGGIHGAVLGGIMAATFLLSEHLGAYSPRGDSFVVRAMKDISELFLIPAAPLVTFASPLLMFLGSVSIYFVLGTLVLGSLYVTVEPKPTIIASRVWSVRSVLLTVGVAVLAVSFLRGYTSWRAWKIYQMTADCEREVVARNVSACETAHTTSQCEREYLACISNHGYESRDGRIVEKQ